LPEGDLPESHFNDLNVLGGKSRRRAVMVPGRCPGQSGPSSRIARTIVRHARRARAMIAASFATA
jgi:hypothetical protein